MSDLTPGKYRAVAVDWSFGFAKTGTPQIAVVFDLLDHPGQQITWYGYFTEKTTDRTLESLRHCGWICDNIEVMEGMGSQDVSLHIDYDRDDEKRERLRVQWVNRGGFVGLSQPMDKAQLAAFARQMRGAAIASRQSCQGGAPAQQRQAPAQRQPYQHSSEPPAFTDEPPF